MMFTPLMTDSLGSLPGELYSHGSAILTTLQQVAGAAGTALFVTVMTLSSDSGGAPDVPGRAGRVHGRRGHLDRRRDAPRSSPAGSPRRRRPYLHTDRREHSAGRHPGRRPDHDVPRPVHDHAAGAHGSRRGQGRDPRRRRAAPRGFRPLAGDGADLPGGQPRQALDRAGPQVARRAGGDPGAGRRRGRVRHQHAPAGGRAARARPRRAVRRRRAAGLRRAARVRRGRAVPRPRRLRRRRPGRERARGAAGRRRRTHLRPLRGRGQDGRGDGPGRGERRPVRPRAHAAAAGSPRCRCSRR